MNESEQSILAAIDRVKRLNCRHPHVDVFGKNIHRCASCLKWWTTPLPEGQ